MAREYQVVDEGADAYIKRVYGEPGLSWREAKKQLRQYYLDRAASVRNMRPQDAFDPGTLEKVEEEITPVTP